MSINPLEIYTKPWTGWDETERSEGSNPLLDPFFDKIKSTVQDKIHDAFKPIVCQGLVDSAVRDGLIDSATGRAILPIVEIVYDKLSPI